MRALLIVLLLSGCASVKPYLVCRLSDHTAEVQQGIGGIGVGQKLTDADVLCVAPVPAK